ncbi:MAG: hypothetical protein HQM10_16565 [Candidatus Riflebacteria bacterium]|nr:hypothetical protein [Candidatus Riflebacteria bacterium]
MKIQDLFTETPLYTILESPFGTDQAKNSKHVDSILRDDETFDMYCVKCKSHSVFKKLENRYSTRYLRIAEESTPVVPDGIYALIAECSRNRDHEARIIVKVENLTLMKIGQYPALADILSEDLRRYKPAIGEERVKEWSRAVGLISHGIGVGSFVYLRRIIESLIEDAHQLASSSSEWDDEDYNNARVQDKILKLKNWLPTFFVENKKAYGILSKGVHELDEKTCLEFFPVLNSAIELIAEEKLAQVEIEKRKKATQNALDKIANSI